MAWYPDRLCVYDCDGFLRVNEWTGGNYNLKPRRRRNCSGNHAFGTASWVKCCLCVYRYQGTYCDINASRSTLFQYPTRRKNEKRERLCPPHPQTTTKASRTSSAIDTFLFLLRKPLRLNPAQRARITMVRPSRSPSWRRLVHLTLSGILGKGVYQ